jgi:hypothetical protein
MAALHPQVIHFTIVLVIIGVHCFYETAERGGEVDQKNPQAAIDAPAILELPDSRRIMRLRRATRQADAFEATGRNDRPLATLEPMLDAYPSLQEWVDRSRGSASAPQRN